MQLLFASIFACLFILVKNEERVDYSGHKVATVVPKTIQDLQLLQTLRSDYGVDLWNEPAYMNASVMMRLKPDLVNPVLGKLKSERIEHSVVFHDLQSVINAEKLEHAPTTNLRTNATTFDFGKYNTYDAIVSYLQSVTSSYPSLAKLGTIGKTYENRPIYVVQISSGSSSSKPAIMIECGIHAREWTSVSSCVYLVNQLITQYNSDSTIKSLVDKYEFHVVPESNPDGYVYTWTQDRLWRKTRSHSSIDWLGVCRGTDANRNFDVEHCGVGTSRKPCDDTFCGDKPFSEAEARALRDLMIKLNNRMSAYFSVHAYSQLWMTPYGTTKKLPPNYNELARIGTAGVTALKKRYGTTFRVGSIANIIYEAAGSSVDYAYIKQNIKIAFALELRDTGRQGFFLSRDQILPAAQETFDGIMGAISAL